MSRRGPATVRNLDAVKVLAEKERLHSCPTVRVHVEVIRALIEADEERAQSETLRAAVKVACEGAPTYDECEKCGVIGPDVEERGGDYPDGVLCQRCEDSRTFGVPSAWDLAWESSKADR